MDVGSLGSEASQGADLLGLALGREPGASDLDEFVEFEIYYDGTCPAAERGEAVPFLRSRLCEAFAVVGSDLERYIWHRDRFVLEVDLGTSTDDEPHLTGHLRTGDGAEDEWFVVYLLRRLTSARQDISCRVIDSDGELILIEAALAAPRWLTPSNAENRCWLRGGLVHLLPRPRPPEPERLPRNQALKRLRAAKGDTAAKDKVQQAISSRLEGYPRRAFELSCHVARAVLPVTLAKLFIAYPQLVSVAADHLPLPSAQELQSLRRQLVGDEKDVRLDCDGSLGQETTCIGVRLTRCQYARLVGLRCQLPQRFTQKHWKPPSGGMVDDKAMHLGAMLCAGLESAYLHGTQSATAVLRWPNIKLASLLPAALPWMPDVSFARFMADLRPRVDPTSALVRRAFVQQSMLDEPFRRAFLAALRNETVAITIDLNDYWRDVDDAEDWLLVSADDLDREMQERYAEFEAFDKRHAAKGTASAGAGAGRGSADAGNTEQLQQEIASMGQEISGLLARASCIDGMEVRHVGCGAGTAVVPTTGKGSAGAGGDSDSDGSGSGDLDVLGQEDEDVSSDNEKEAEEPGGSFRDYLSELDEQLEGAFDEMPPPANGSKLDMNSLPLGSHHIKVHQAGPIELDLHAMEHMLASYCSEHQLAPGPASLLLGELGLMSAAAAGIANLSGGSLDVMD